MSDLARETAWRVWLASATIYNTAINEQGVRKLFEMWWKRNGNEVVRKELANG